MNQYMPNCPVEIVMMFLKDRVGVLIVGYLLKDSMSPVQLQEKIESTPLPILKERIKEMEEYGIVMKENEVLTLTGFGRSFYSIIAEMNEWGEKHNAQTALD